MGMTTATRRKVLLLGAVAPLALVATPAHAGIFTPIVTAKQIGQKVSVKIWVTLKSGPINLVKRFIGTFLVAAGTLLRRTIHIGIVTIKLTIKWLASKIRTVFNVTSTVFQKIRKVVFTTIT